MRRIYKTEYTPDKFQFYINSFDDSFWENVWGPETVEGKAFDAFRMLFYSGQIEVLD